MDMRMTFVSVDNNLASEANAILRNYTLTPLDHVLNSI